MDEPTIWALNDGKAGMVNQSLGLAEAVARRLADARVVDKRVRPARPWSWLPAGLWPPGVFGAASDSDPLGPPWPDLVVGCGRHAIGPALAIKRRSGGRSMIVHAQHPRMATARYDLVVAQAHDRLDGPNVMVTQGSMHRVTAARLAEAEASFGDRFADLPRPRIAVLIGGSNRTYRLDARRMQTLLGGLAALMERDGAGLLVTASRRTGESNITLLREALEGRPADLWEGDGENPYFAYLALADAFVVTADSINMVSEACFTGKPVHVAALDGGDDGKFEHFHEEMRAAGYTRPFEGRLESWSYTPLDETARIADVLARRLEERFAGDRLTRWS